MMRWAEVPPSVPTRNSNSNNPIRNEETSAPTIKNHSVTHYNGTLYCFGGYDGRRNHLTLLLYNLERGKWIRPHHLPPDQPFPNSYHHHAAPAGMLNLQDDNSNGDVNMNIIPNNQDGSSLIQDHTIYVAGSPPPGRNGHSATLAMDEDDEDTARIIIIGGWLGTGPLAASDMHVLDITNGGRHLRWYQPAVKGTPPGPCNMHSADYIPKRNEVYVFRGGNGREYLNDLHALHTQSFTWRRVETTGQIPQQRANHSSAMLEETGELFIFGGWNGTERLNDIHILNTETNVWTCPHVGGVLPHPRAGMTLTALRGRLYLFGGSGTSSKCFQDLQILDRQEMAWLDVTQIVNNSNGEGGRARYDSHESTQSQYVDLHHHQQHQRWTFGGYDQGPAGAGDYHNPHHHNNMQGVVVDHHGSGSGSMQDGEGSRSFAASHADWRTRDLESVRSNGRAAMVAASPNPNDEDSIPTVQVQGRCPGRRAGHTATAVNRKIYIFGGSCGSDYLGDFFVLDTDPPPHAVVREPTSLHLIERRLRHFFNDEDFADVTFLVQGQRVYGHKMILSLVSDCFRAMFTAGFREQESHIEIEIPDCSHIAFLAVMEYIYTGHIPHPNYNGSSNEVNINRVVEILELADRFFLDHLKESCETILQPTVSQETVEYLLQVAQKTNATQLQAICEHFVRNHQINNNGAAAPAAVAGGRPQPPPPQRRMIQEQPQDDQNPNDMMMM